MYVYFSGEAKGRRKKEEGDIRRNKEEENEGYLFFIIRKGRVYSRFIPS